MRNYNVLVNMQFIIRIIFIHRTELGTVRQYILTCKKKKCTTWIKLAIRIDQISNVLLQGILWRVVFKNKWDKNHYFS